jgi:hypothetical protein
MLTQNNRYRNSENHHALIPLPFTTKRYAGVWCTISANCIIGSIFYEGTIDAERHIN